MKIYRQGDVALIQHVTVQGKEGVRGRVVLAQGTATGHSHVLENAVLLEQNGKKFVLVDSATRLVHDEHDPITIPPGTYLVVRQAEWSSEEYRQVED